MELELQVKKLDPGAYEPTRGHPTDTGLDITPIGIAKKIDTATFLLHTGLAIKPPEGFYIDMVPRSSMSKKKFMLANSIGIIDESYRGEMMIPVRRFDWLDDVEDLLHKPLVQLILRRLYIPKVVMVEELDKTVRGSKGFGSTSGC
jgi:dUTP pyrophosphatase